MVLSISEILELTNKIFKKKEQIDFLRKHDSLPLRGILKFALDPNIEWLLPPGPPPYKPCEALDQEGQLYQQASKLMRFVKGGGYDDLRPAKREALFISLLESLTPGDAELMTFVKDKMINYPDITTGLVQEAFPGLLGPIKTKRATTTAEVSTPLSVASVEASSAIQEVNDPRPPNPNPNPIEKKRIRISSAKKVDGRTKGYGGPKSASGIRNVNWNKEKKKWMAKRCIGRKQFMIGYFEDPNDANRAVEVFCQEHGLIR